MVFQRHLRFLGARRQNLRQNAHRREGRKIKKLIENQDDIALQ
jgi:hypothetical protein